MSKNVIFPDTKEFDQKLAPEMKAKMDAILNPLGLNSVAIGSAHTPTPGEMSGDMDLQVDLDEVKAKFKTDDDKAARKSLAQFVQDRGFQVRQAGVNVFVRLPVGDEFYQVDLETIPNVAKVSRYHQHKIPKGSVYKGVGKQLMLAQLAKSKGYMYSAWQGLFARTPENKKGELVADEWDAIAQVLLGPNATGDNIDSVEAIMASLPPEQGQALLAHVKQDKNWAERTPKISEDISRIKELAGTQATPTPREDPKKDAFGRDIAAMQAAQQGKDAFGRDIAAMQAAQQGKDAFGRDIAAMQAAGNNRAASTGKDTFWKNWDSMNPEQQRAAMQAAAQGNDRFNRSAGPAPVQESISKFLRIVKEAEINQPAAPATAAPATAAPTTAAPTTPQVDPAKYQVPSIDFFKKNYKHPADIIDGAHPSTSDPTRIGAWKGGSDFADLMMALSGSYYQARQADPNFKQPAFVKDDWELIQRMLGTPEGKEYAIDQSIGLSNIDDKSPDAEFNRAQHKEFEKQANARFMQQPDGIFTPGWKYDQKLGMTPAQAELQKQKAQQTVPVQENISKFLRILKEAEINQPAANNPALPTADEINKIKASIPQLPAQDGDLGGGIHVQTNRDGTRSYKSGAGTYTYNAQGTAITYTSPKMSGFGQTLDLTTNEITLDYHAGPLSTTAKTDAQGRPITSKVKYDLGGGQYHSLDKEIDHASSITSTTLTPGGGVDPNKLLPTAAIAKAKGVDPAKFAAFQKQNPTAVKESPELIAMLSIAGLR